MVWSVFDGIYNAPEHIEFLVKISIVGLATARGISAFNGSIDPRTTLLYSFPAFSQIGAMSKPISSLLTTFLRARSMAGGISGATLRLIRYWHLWL